MTRQEDYQYHLEMLRDKNLLRYRVKTIKSGPILECEIYPIWKTPRAYSSKRKNATRKAQERLNIKNAKKKLTRLINTNFSEKDIWATFTYSKESLPASMDEAKKDMVNYIRRLSRYIKKNNLEPLKYIYVTECGKKRVHHHIIMNFPDREKAEEIWDKPGRKQTRRLQPDDHGLEGLARYIGKGPADKNEKKYTCSKNLTKPTITTADTKLTKRKAEELARNPGLAAEVFENLYKGYGYLDMKVSFSDFVPGAYIYTKMKKGGKKDDNKHRWKQRAPL